MVDQCVKDWIDLDFIGPSGVFDICSAKSKAERNEWIDRFPTEAFKAASEATITNDMEIVADGLAAGAIEGIGKRVAALRGKLGIGDTIDKGPIEWRGD